MVAVSKPLTVLCMSQTAQHQDLCMNCGPHILYMVTLCTHAGWLFCQYAAVTCMLASEKMGRRRLLTHFTRVQVLPHREVEVFNIVTVMGPSPVLHALHAALQSACT